MGLIIVGISYRLMLAAIFCFVTTKTWLVNPLPVLGTGCLLYALFNQSPDASMDVITVIGFFLYDVLGWAKYLDKSKKPKTA